MGLLQFAPNGKVQLIPVTILVDGQYYDASAYKASPVPMALWGETEYEAVRSGISEGLFVVTAALQNQKTNQWIGEGRWQTEEELAANAKKKPASSVPRGVDEDSGPPVLRHSGSSKPKPPDAAQGSTTTTAAQVPSGSPTQGSGAPPAPTPAPASTAAAASTPSPTSAAPSAIPVPQASTSPDEEDPNHPKLKRGKPTQAAPEPNWPVATPPKPTSPAAASAAPSAAAAKASQTKLIPAISDANGPDPHSYIYDAKPDDQLSLRNKTLALAADEVRARAKQLASEVVGSEPPRNTKTRAAKPPQPAFDDVQFRIFDLSSSNEPVMVLTATAHLPATTAHNASADLQYFVTIVARQDINGDLHKAFAKATDSQHLDVEARYDLIDAVDVDGDGRAELLFRKVSDAGSAFVVYRVIGDQLYALYEGSPV